MKSSFQTILMIVFIAAFVIGVAVFSGLFSSGSQSASTEPQGKVIVWGTLPSETMFTYVDTFNATNPGYSVVYEEHSADTFNREFITAIADGTPPDVVLFPSELYSQIKERLYTIVYAAMPERGFRDTYIDGAQMYLESDGVKGIPLVVDPLVTYYNKDMLAAARFIVPPTTWGTLTKAVPLFTRRSSQNTITQSAIALGDGVNVDHMRDILSALFLQTGNSIVDKNGNATFASGATGADQSTLLTAQALSFYTSFSDPTSSVYSWNRSLPHSLANFLAGNSVFYIGRASELFTIQAQNPNLNFDVMNIFQPDQAVREITYGSFITAAVTKNSTNFTAAYAYLGALISSNGVDELSKRLSLPPTRRDLLLVQQTNPYVSVFFKAALSAFSWPDPDPSATNTVFQAMISNVTSGRTNAASALTTAARDL